MNLFILIYLCIPTVILIDLGKQHSTVYTSQTSLNPKAAPIATAAAFSVDKTEEDEDPDSLSDSEEVDFFWFSWTLSDPFSRSVWKQPSS